MVIVTGPITGGKHGWPFGAATRDLAAEGYVEEEYLVRGEAPRYRATGELGQDGRWAAERAGSAPFATRAVVRRPLDPARFNGTVIVEWNNVSAGCEIFEAGDTSVVFDEGFAYVGVSAQRVGVHGHDVDPQGLTAWDPERYGELEIVDDAISYGVFTEVARAVSAGRDGEPDPLGGLAVRHLLAVGGSQSAGRLATYVDAIQPLERVFDGFVLFTWFGSGMSIDDPRTFNIADPEAASQIRRHVAQIRDDLDVPVMVVNSECETLSMLPVRQADTDRFRFWEVAGAPHGPQLHMERIMSKMLRDQVGLPTPPDATPVHAVLLGQVPFAPVLDTAIAAMPGWMDGGAPPSVQPRIEVAGGAVRRDADGNALGGIRLPEQEVTLTRNVGAIEEAGTGGLMGVTTPLPDEVVAARYPDAGAYLAAFRDAADRAVAAGVLRPRDAGEAIDRATRRATSLPA